MSSLETQPALRLSAESYCRKEIPAIELFINI